MELKEFLIKKGFSMAEMAEFLGCSRPFVLSLARKKSTPNLAVAMKIFHMTDGMVSFEELLKEEDLKSWEEFCLMREFDE